VIYHDPYQYNVKGSKGDYIMQDSPEPSAAKRMERIRTETREFPPLSSKQKNRKNVIYNLPARSNAASPLWEARRLLQPELPKSSPEQERLRKAESGVGIFAITMSFVAFTSALFVRQGSGADWTHIALPPVLYGNTLALLLSSATLQLARRALAAVPSVEPRAVRMGLGWLMATLALGFRFRRRAIRSLAPARCAGLYLATNPNSSFYYVFTAMHGLHVLAGIVALALVIGRIIASRAAFRRSTFEATATYWHFMGVLWLYLLFGFAHEIVGVSKREGL